MSYFGQNMPYHGQKNACIIEDERGGRDAENAFKSSIHLYFIVYDKLQFKYLQHSNS